jgi:hypothetical protein
MEDKVRVKEVKVLSDDWYTLKKTTFDFRRKDGSWQTVSRKVFEAYMSPGSVTEKLHFFIAEYDDTSSKTEGGGDALHGEGIEVLELALDDALQIIERGEIQDGKTIMLLQYAKLKRLID